MEYQTVVTMNGKKNYQTVVTMNGENQKRQEWIGYSTATQSGICIPPRESKKKKKKLLRMIGEGRDNPNLRGV